MGKGNWQNWSGSVTAKPQVVLKPQSIEELVAFVKEAGQARQIRVVGAGHSFTPLVLTDDVLISLDALQGVEHVDSESGRVTVLGGTRLSALGEALLACGLAQENLGDIDVQSIAGAISTGTHGTGIAFGSLATQVVGLTLVTANGELLECSEGQNREIFKAAQVSMGMLGIIVKVVLRVVPAKRLHAKTYRTTLTECLNKLEKYKQENDHFEFYWFPYTDTVQIKLLNKTDKPASKSSLWANFSKVVIENGAFWLLSEWSRLWPRFAKTVSKISAQSIPSVEEIHYSHRIFTTLRVVRFQEMEYNIPAEHFAAAIRDIQECVEQKKFAVHFPVECRFVRGDDIWLSPAYQRDSAYIAVHMYRGMEYEVYFHEIEAILQRYQGRPHWGKMHTLNGKQLGTLYPYWQSFLHVREQLDPQGIFLNGYLREMMYN